MFSSPLGDFFLYTMDPVPYVTGYSKVLVPLRGFLFIYFLKKEVAK